MKLVAEADNLCTQTCTCIIVKFTLLEHLKCIYHLANDYYCLPGLCNCFCHGFCQCSESIACRSESYSRPKHGMTADAEDNPWIRQAVSLAVVDYLQILIHEDSDYPQMQISCIHTPLMHIVMFSCSEVGSRFT